MKRYLVITQLMTKSDDTVFESDHSIAYTSMRRAAEAQADHMERSEYTCVGFRIVELESKDDI